MKQIEISDKDHVALTTVADELKVTIPELISEMIENLRSEGIW